MFVSCSYFAIDQFFRIPGIIIINFHQETDFTKIQHMLNFVAKGGLQHADSIYYVLVFKCLRYKSFENTVGKGGIARNEQFLLFLQCFLPSWTSSCHFYQIQNCCLQTLSGWKSKKFVTWERVNHTWRQQIKQEGHDGPVSLH